MKILYFGECGVGALAIIHRDIKKIIDKKYSKIQFDILDGAYPPNRETFSTHFPWKQYDIIIIEPILFSDKFAEWQTFNANDSVLFNNKLVPVYHADIDIPAAHFQHGWYEARFTTPVCGINPYIVNQIRERGVDSQLLPIGVCKERFKPFKEVKKIKKIGIVGNYLHTQMSPEWNSIKRPDLFKQICDKVGIEYVAIFGKDNNWKMYEDVDAIICTSSTEGNPMGFLEAAACKIPFISTNVGIVREYNKVKTFETIDQAVEIINHLNESEDNVKDYVDGIYGEMFPDREWENILDKYWIPYFKEL